MTLPQDITKLQSEMSAAVREHWKAFLFEGILLAVLGLAAMILPPLASLAVTIFLGWMFLISGVAGLGLTFWERWSWLLIAGIMDLLIAAVIITGLPGSALWAVGLLVGINLLFGGASLIGMALAARKG
jgi:uncharacterized membrane protein HdeD (DUF308 family)